MKTAVIYARYSSERQTEQSIEGQVRECMEYAKRNDIVIVDTYIDRAMTGTNDNRSDFQRMLKDSAKKPWDLILVYNGRKLGKNMVYRILQNERYAGIYRHHSDGVFTNTFPQIVPDNLFEAVRQICINNKLGARSQEVVYLLRNKIRCGYCGSTICAETGTSKSGKVMRYYKCNGRKVDKTCKKSVVRKEDVENLVIETTLKVLNNPENVDLIADKIFEANQRHVTDTSVYGLLVAEQQETRKALDNMLKAVEQGIITISTKQRIEELEGKLDELNAKIEIETSKVKIRMTKTDIKRFINKAIRKEPLPMIRMLVEKVILYDDRVEIYYYHTDRKPDAIEHQAFSFYSENIDYDINDWWAHDNQTKCTITVAMFF